MIHVPRDHSGFWFRLRVITEIDSLVIRIRSPGEAEIRAIIAGAPTAVRAVIEMAFVFVVTERVAEAVARSIKIACRVVAETRHGNRRRVKIRARVRKAAARSRPEDLKIESSLLVQLEAPVNSRELVVLLDKIVTGCQKANARLFANVVLCPNDGDVSVLVQKTEIHRIVALIPDEVPGRLIAR